jgi:hypothetical protein
MFRKGREHFLAFVLAQAILIKPSFSAREDSNFMKIKHVEKL